MKQILFSLLIRNPERQSTNNAMGTALQDADTKEIEFNLSLHESTPTEGEEAKDTGWIFRDKRPFSIKDDILSLRYKKEWCDTLIKVGQSTTLAHKAVLSAECKMFKGLFRSGFLEDITNQVDLSHLFSDISMADVFINYLYTGRVLLSDRNIESILETSHMMLMENLQNHCLQFLLHRLSVANVISTMELAERYDIVRLIEVCDSLLQRSEDLILFSPEIAEMKSQNFLAFLETEVISKYGRSVRSSLVLFWLSADIRKRAACVASWLRTNPPCKHTIKRLPLSRKEKHELVAWFGELKLNNEIPAFIMKETSADHPPLIGNWTVAVQSHCGKTGFYCPELRKWYVLNLPVIEGDILGLLDDNYLAYLETEINAIACIKLSCGTIKRTAIPGSCPQHTYENCDFGSARPYHYFCRYGRLYGINPITSTQQNLKIVGWGVYRYFIGEESGWQQLGDTIFSRDFDRNLHPRSEVMMLPICDPIGYNPDEPVVYIFLQENVTSGDASVTFLYNHQVREYYSFTVCKSLARKRFDILVLPEVVFVARFNTVIGLSDLPTELNFTEENSTGELNLSVENTNSFLKSSDFISLTVTKPPHLPLRHRRSPSAVSSNTGKKTTPLCLFTSSKQVALFDGNIYLAAHLSPLDYQVMIYDLNNHPRGNLPPVPFPTRCEMRMTPMRTMEPISTLVEACKNKKTTRHAVKQNVTKKIFRDWVFSSWKGQYKIVSEADLINTCSSDE